MKYFIIFLILMGFSIVALQSAMAEEQVYMLVDNKIKKLYYTGNNINSAFFDLHTNSVLFEIGTNANLEVKAPKMHKHGEALFVLKNGEEIIPKSLNTDDCFYFATFEFQEPGRLELIFSYWPEQHTELIDHCESFRPSPLKQTQLGVSLDKIECKENLLLIQKYDSSPACVKPETKQKLIERGWTQGIYNKDQNPSLSENSIELYKKKYDAVIEGKVLWSIGHKGYPVRIQHEIEPIKIHKAHPALRDNTISFLSEKETATEIGKIAVFGLDYDEKDNYFRLVDRFILDSSNSESEPSTVIEISFGKAMTRKFLPVVFNEITTNVESLDEITVWNFELIGHSGDDRRIVWDTVPRDTGIFYEITDGSGQDIIDHSRMSENWAIPSDQHVYNMDCGVFHTVAGESAHPSSFPIKNNHSTINAKNSWMGIYPNSDGEYSFEFASIFETMVKLPEGAKIISQESKHCKLTQNIEDDPEGKYTDGYYTKMVFRLE